MSFPLQLTRWNSWREKSVNRRIFAAMVTVGGLAFFVKVIAMFKEVTVARQYGVGDGMDAFLIAYVLPSFAMNVIGGSFNAALIPTYIQVREQEGQAAAQKLFSNIMICSAAMFAAISLVLAAAAPFVLQLLGSGFSGEKLQLTRSLFLALLPLLPLNGVAVIWGAVLNAGERFALAAIAPVITSLCVILIVPHLDKAYGIYALAGAMVTGATIEGVLLAAALKRQGLSIFPRWHGINPATRQVVRQYVPMIAGALMMGSTALVDQAMAAMLGSGSVSVLNYGNKVSAVIVGIGAMALSTAALPQFSRMVAAEDWSGVRNTLRTYTRLILLITIPLTLLLVLFSQPLVSFLFQRGAFTASDAYEVAAVQRSYILQLPFYVLGIFFVRLISAMKANHILMWGAAISFVLNITLDYVLMRLLGVPGIGLSTSVVYMAALGYLSFMSLRLLRKQQMCEGT